MTQPTNLNRARKERARAGKSAKGDANALKFGRSRAEKQADAARASLAARKLDGAKREE
jgi:hypothetical protein